MPKADRGAVTEQAVGGILLRDRRRQEGEEGLRLRHPLASRWPVAEPAVMQAHHGPDHAPHVPAGESVIAHEADSVRGQAAGADLPDPGPARPQVPRNRRRGR